jgi:hypothetical protein
VLQGRIPPFSSFPWCGPESEEPNLFPATFTQL